jgi:hypothetical protein
MRPSRINKAEQPGDANRFNLFGGEIAPLCQHRQLPHAFCRGLPLGLSSAALDCKKLRCAHAFNNGHKEFDNWGLTRETQG